MSAGRRLRLSGWVAWRDVPPGSIVAEATGRTLWVRCADGWGVSVGRAVTAYEVSRALTRARRRQQPWDFLQRGHVVVAPIVSGSALTDRGLIRVAVALVRRRDVHCYCGRWRS